MNENKIDQIVSEVMKRVSNQPEENRPYNL